MKKLTKNAGALFLALVMLLSLFASPITTYAAEGVDPYDYIYGKNYDVSKGSGLYIGEGEMVCGGNTGKYIGFKNVSFDRKPYELVIWLATGQFGQADLRLDSPDGETIATLTPKIGAWDASEEIAVGIKAEVRGKHDLYFVWTAGPCNFDKMIFHTRETVSAVSRYADFNEASAYSDISGTKYENAIETALALGLMPAPAGETFKPEKPVTRSTFAKVISNILNKSTGADVSFTDVEITDENYDAICAVAEAGILKGISETEFGVNSFLTVRDALVASLRLLGYEQTAEAKGGYPNGYSTLAAKLKLTNGLDAADTLRNGNLAKVIVNVINADYMSETGYLFDMDSNDGDLVKVGYEAVAGILSKTKGIYKKTGVVEANAVTSIYSPTGGTDANAVIINNVRYDAGSTAACSMIGLLCDYYYTEDDTLAAIVPSINLNQVILNNASLTELNMNKISYYESEESTKLRTLKCSTRTLYLYNGVALEGEEITDVITNPAGFTGKIRWIDNDKDESADVVYIDEPQNLVISSVSEEHISGKLDSTAVSKSFPDAVTVFNKDGEEVGLNKIELGSVCMLYVSRNTSGKKYVRVNTYTESVTGTVTQTDAGKAVIDGVSYDTLITVKAGQNGTFYLNANDEIVNYSATVGGGKLVGLYLECSKIKTTTSTLHVKIVTKDGVVLLPCANKTWIDGVKCAEYINQETAFAAVTKKTPILYRLNADGEITMVDTVASGTGGDNDSLRKINSATSIYYQAKNHCFTETSKPKYPVADDAVFMSYGNTDDDSACAVVDFDSAIRDGLCITADFYSTKSGSSKIADIVLWPNKWNDNTGGNQWTAKTVMVKNIFKYADSEGNESLGILGYEGKNQTKLYVNAAALEADVMTSSGSHPLAQTVNSLVAGDLIQCQKNGNDEVIGIKLVYHQNKDKNSANLQPEHYYINGSGNVFTGGDQYYNVNMLATIGETDGRFLEINLLNGEKIYLVIDPATPVTEFDRTSQRISRDSSAAALTAGDEVVINVFESLVCQIFKFVN